MLHDPRLHSVLQRTESPAPDRKILDIGGYSANSISVRPNEVKRLMWILVDGPVISSVLFNASDAQYGHDDELITRLQRFLPGGPLMDHIHCELLTVI
jgi:hypothetical protein